MSGFLVGHEFQNRENPWQEFVRSVFPDHNCIEAFAVGQALDPFLPTTYHDSNSFHWVDVPFLQVQ
jgi:hypothetical protein